MASAQNLKVPKLRVFDQCGNLEGAELDLHHALHEGDCCGIFEGVPGDY